VSGLEFSGSIPCALEVDEGFPCLIPQEVRLQVSNLTFQAQCVAGFCNTEPSSECLVVCVLDILAGLIELLGVRN
jgi:hypothetical protein